MKLFKIVVTVPQDDADALRDAIGAAGGGTIGHYAYCSFSSVGTGRFLPLDGAKPAIGNVGALEPVIEERIEINCDETNFKPVVAAIRAAHPDEEPVIDVYQLMAV